MAALPRFQRRSNRVAIPSFSAHCQRRLLRATAARTLKGNANARTHQSAADRPVVAGKASFKWPSRLLARLAATDTPPAGSLSEIAVSRTLTPTCGSRQSVRGLRADGNLSCVDMRHERQ